MFSITDGKSGADVKPQPRFGSLIVLMVKEHRSTRLALGARRDTMNSTSTSFRESLRMFGGWLATMLTWFKLVGFSDPRSNFLSSSAP